MAGSGEPFPSVTQNWHSHFLPEIPLTSYHKKDGWVYVQPLYTQKYQRCWLRFTQLPWYKNKEQNIKASPRRRKVTEEEFKIAQTESVDAK